jgi:hypothetical protein
VCVGVGGAAAVVPKAKSHSSPSRSASCPRPSSWPIVPWIIYGRRLQSGHPPDAHLAVLEPRLD